MIETGKNSLLEYDNFGYSVCLQSFENGPGTRNEHQSCYEMDSRNVSCHLLLFLIAIFLLERNLSKNETTDSTTRTEPTVLFLKFPENSSQGVLNFLLNLESLGMTPLFSSCGLYIWRTYQNITVVDGELCSVLKTFEDPRNQWRSNLISSARLQVSENGYCRKNFHVCVVDKERALVSS